MFREKLKEACDGKKADDIYASPEEKEIYRRGSLLSFVISLFVYLLSDPA